MLQHGCKFFASRHPTPDTGGQKVKTLPFSKHSHFAYQIKRNHKCSNTLAFFLPAVPNRSWEGLLFLKAKIQLFQNMVILHIKFKGITNAPT